MAIEKLPEFAKNGQKDTDKLNQEDGFPVNLKPARQWFNYLFNKFTVTVNLLINEDYLPRREIINNLTTKDAKKPLSAEMGKKLNDEKLAKTENATSATKLATIRTVQFSGAATGSFTYNGSANSSAVLTLANSGVTARAYGAALKVPVITVNAKGLITVVTEQAIPAYSGTTSLGLVPARIGSTTVKLLCETGKWVDPVTYAIMSDVEMKAGTAQTARALSAIALKNAILHWSPNHSGDLDILLYSPIPYSKTVAPSGFLIMLGQSISQSTYPKLFARYGSNLPDMRSEFVRGLDNGRGIDSNRAILSSQSASAIGFYVGGIADNTLISFVDVRNHDPQNNDSSTGYRRYASYNDRGTAAQKLKPIRPRNIAYLYIVKAG